jgi:hypothetical protein
MNYSANYPSSVVVNGGPAYVNVDFSNSSFPVTVLESGLPAQALWMVTARNSTNLQSYSGESTGTTITLRLGDGAYSLSVTGPLGYDGSLSVSLISVRDSSPNPITAEFTASPTGNVASTTLPWLTTGILVITAIVGIVSASWGYARHRFEQRRSRALGWIREFHNDAVEADERHPR